MPALDLVLLAASVRLIGHLTIPINDSSILGSGNIWGLLVYALAVICGIAVSGAFRRPARRRSLSAAAELILGVIFGSGLGFFVVYVVFLGSPLIVHESRAALLFGTLLFLLPCLSLHHLIRWLTLRAADSRPYLLIGKETSRTNFREIYREAGIGNPLVEFSPEEHIVADRDEGVWNRIAEHFEAIILTDPSTEWKPELVDFLANLHFAKLPVLTMNSFFPMMWRQVPTLHLDADWVFEQDFSLADRSKYLAVKRALELIISAIALIILAPVMAIIALAIQIDSRGPIIFSQERVGRFRKPFNVLKFRTMTEYAESGDPYTAKSDPRITRLGKVIRRLGLDELPQLLNVIKGDMSLIGPRPEWTRLAAEYESSIPFYHLRHLVRPGITGWAQLNLPYGDSPDDAWRKLRFDLYYIKFHSPLLDLEILLKTSLHFLAMRGR